MYTLKKPILGVPCSIGDSVSPSDLASFKIDAERASYFVSIGVLVDDGAGVEQDVAPAPQVQKRGSKK